ncbi:hypothetical protein LTR56_001441 [Elasticomyces elasticus]|nr:hypothetical protein LTR56_001441 [Elasticomyces elasticus]KAK3668636.1 hypothetical protein LTR22_000523 [Elasticomyces elasticus]KAK4931988.1 hypothetical protein LTR49_001675 [Elasticomyces elasticus]KAK5768480.1 hypothetical protein LTS12_001268 [Elasticomyces elasticus]
MTRKTQDVEIRNAYLDALKSGATQPDVQVHRDDLLDLFKHQQQVIDNFAVLESGSREGDTSKTTALTECRSSMEVMRSFLCHFMQHDPLKTLPSARSKKAADQVFSISELAEIILLELDTSSILQAMQACTALAACVTSPRIQVKLGLRAQPDSDWFSPFCGYELNSSSGSQSIGRSKFYEMLTCELESVVSLDRKMEDVMKPRRVSLYASFEGQVDCHYDEPAELPEVGERIQSMLICQPPITEMAIQLNCCLPDGEDYARVEAQKVVNSQGITLGDLLRATVQYREDHKLCPYAREFYHDPETGFVKVDVSFWGELHLDPSDPVFASGSGQSRSEGRSSTPIGGLEEPNERLVKLHEYMAYKDEAEGSGETILTMAEFNRTNQR